MDEETFRDAFKASGTRLMRGVGTDEFVAELEARRAGAELVGTQE